MSRTFDHTRAALVEFDAGQLHRAALWRDINTAHGLDRARYADAAALRKVQVAFHKDTQDINSLSHCLCADIGFMRRMAKLAGGAT